MILVITGTNPYSFERLVRAVDDWARLNHKDVFIQLGNTPYEPTCCRFRRFLPLDQMRTLICDAEVVICQGGFGSLRDCLAAGKKVVAVPRYPSLGESTDDQEETVRSLEEDGRLLAVYDITDLAETIARSRDFQPSHGVPSRVVDIVEDYINRTCFRHKRFAGQWIVFG